MAIKSTFEARISLHRWTLSGINLIVTGARVSTLWPKRRQTHVCGSHERIFKIFIFFKGWDWVHLVLRPLFGLFYQPQMIDVDDCRAIGGLRIGRRNLNIRRKPAPVPLRSPQNSHGLNRARTPASAAGSRRRTPLLWHDRHIYVNNFFG
jgi:hypothetical protein